MKTALIMGGTQFFGKRLVASLLQKGWDVTIATRGKTADPFGDQVNRLIIDREDRSSLEKAFEGKRWDVVYDQTCYSPQEAQDACEIFADKAGRYVFTSTMAVYEHGSNLAEEAFDPYSYPIHKIGSRRDYSGISGYQEAKRTAEAILFQRADFPVVAVRFPLVIGPDDFTDRLRFHVEHVQKQMAIGIPDLDITLGFISSEDAGNTLSWLAESELTGPVNSCSYGQITLRELLGMIEEIVGKKALVAAQTEPEHQSPYGLPGSWSVSEDKIKKAGFAASPLQDWLPDLLKSYVVVE